MGVEDLAGMDTPQKKGGRPKGSTKTKEKTGREVDGDPYTREHGDEYWKEVWEINHTEDGSLRTDILNAAQYTSCLPRTVVENVHNRDVFSFEELAEDPPEWFQHHLESLELEGINTSFAPSPKTDSSSGPSSGLSSLVGDDDNDDGGTSGFLDDHNEDEDGDDDVDLSSLLD